MKETVNNLLDKLSALAPNVDVAVLMGLFGGILILALFFIALGIGTGSKVSRYGKQLISSTKYLHDQEPVDDSNVDKIYRELEKHPEEVQKGWQCFMDQRIGFPSDYIAGKEVLSTRQFSGKVTISKVFMIIFGALVWAAVAVCGFVAGNVNTDSALAVITSLEFVIIPTAVYVIALILIDLIFTRKVTRLEMAFMSFCEMLDSKIVISDKEEREFVSDNLEEISKRVEEILANRIDDSEVIEVITAPKIEEVEEEIMPVFDEPEEEEDYYDEPEPEVPQPRILAEMTADEKENYFQLLINLVDRAINDENCDEDDYAMIAAAINDESISSGAINDPEDMAIFETCFRRLAEKVSA